MDYETNNDILHKALSCKLVLEDIQQAVFIREQEY